MNHYERSFHEDIREKKRIGNNIHKKTGIRGYVGSMRTPSDLMSAKDRKLYQAAGKVEISNMYDQLMTSEEFEALDDEKKKTALIRWRELYTNAKIREALGYASEGKLYYMMDKLGIERPRRQRRSGTAAKKKKAPAKQQAPTKEKEVPKIEKIETNAVSETDIPRGHVTTYNQIYDSSELAKILTRLQLTYEDEPKKYAVKIIIQEIDED